MLGEVLTARVETGFVALRTLYTALQVVGHDGARCAAEELERPHMGAKPSRR